MVSTNNLLARARDEGTPLIDGNGHKAIFVWEGETAPQIIGDFNDWGESPAGADYLEQIENGVWTYELELPDDAYIEYVFTNDPDDEDERVLDPFNRNQVANGLGKTNHYFSMPKAKHTPLTEFVSGTPQGSITRHVLRSQNLFFGGRRDVWLYHPPTKEEVPLLLVYDGRDYMRRAELPQIIANMIAQKMIRPIALAMIDNGKEGRFMEYNSSESTVQAIVDLLMPLADYRLNLIDPWANPGAFGVMGASMGGLMALYTAMRQPDIFGKVVTQSGAFHMRVNDVDPMIKKLVKDASTKDLKIWQDVGKFEYLLEANREMHDLLVQKGYDVTYREYQAGHNFTSWRNMIPDALMTLFPAE